MNIKLQIYQDSKGLRIPIFFYKLGSLEYISASYTKIASPMLFLKPAFDISMFGIRLWFIINIIFDLLLQLFVIYLIFPNETLIFNYPSFENVTAQVHYLLVDIVF